MERFDFHRIPINLMMQDVIIAVLPVVLLLIGLLWFS